MASVTQRKIAPGVRQYVPLPIGWVAMARNRPIDFLMYGFRTFGDVFRYQSGPFVFHLLSHPDYVKHVLQDHSKNYPRSRFQDLMKLAVGEGLVTSEGPYWLRQRRLAQPAFHRQRVSALAGVMIDSIQSMLGRWQAHAARGQPLDVAAEMMRLTLSIAGKTLFGYDMSGDADAMGHAVTAVFEYLNFRINHLLALPVAFPTPRNLRFRRALGTLDRVVYDIIDRRRRDGQDTGDLLSVLLTAQDEETGERMTDRQLRDEVITFIGAGHETTAQALAWTFYLLSQHPEVDRRFRAEVADVVATRTPTAQDLANLTYTRRVIEESLRLYPPVWGMTRGVTEDDVIGGYHIPARSIVIVCQYVTHRHPAFWDDPERFDPDRFLPERIAALPRYAYFPFAGGPHQCIGNEFAIMEAQLVLAMVAQRYRLSLVPGNSVEPDPIFTLRPRPGVVMALHANGLSG
jgi:cytochrome P450